MEREGQAFLQKQGRSNQENQFVGHFDTIFNPVRVGLTLVALNPRVATRGK
jgi:hypothetical protein